VVKFSLPVAKSASSAQVLWQISIVVRTRSSPVTIVVNATAAQVALSAKEWTTSEFNGVGGAQVDARTKSTSMVPLESAL
jgi:hypothetical protein